jgi:fumarate reductase subunit D
MRIPIASRRDAVSAVVGGVVALIGWASSPLVWRYQQFAPLQVFHQPGLELVVFLRFKYLPFREAVAAPESTVAAMNFLVWTAVTFGVMSWWGAISRAWRASSIRWAVLLAAGITAVAELNTYDNFAALPGAYWLVSPGWFMATRIAPITSFVIDFRTPLGLFDYPDRLLTTTLAVIGSIVIWSALLFCFASVAKVAMRNRTHDAHA